MQKTSSDDGWHQILSEYENHLSQLKNELLFEVKYDVINPMFLVILTLSI
jgi:hypothetical protein